MSWSINDYKYRCFKPRSGLYKKGLSYDKQGAIYFACKHYFTLFTAEEQERFRRLLFECGKRKQNNFNALFEYVTCELTAREVCEIYNIGKSNFYRYLDDFYLNFDYVKKVY